MALRFLSLELDEIRDLAAAGLSDPVGLCAPDDEHLFIVDRPASGARVVRLGGRGPREIELPGFVPRLLADSSDGEILAVGKGPAGNGLLFDAHGAVRRAFDFGDGIADVSFDPAGNILVLRPKGRPLLAKFGPDGEPLDDGFVASVLASTEQRDGMMLLVQNDGAAWLNLAEKYDESGRPLERVEPAAVFGEGRVSADVLGWDVTVVLDASGRLWALLDEGRRRQIPLPAVPELGRPLTGQRDLLCARGERLRVLATDRKLLLSCRVLSE